MHFSKENVSKNENSTKSDARIFPKQFFEVQKCKIKYYKNSFNSYSNKGLDDDGFNS